jgi:FkbM family methyltransferase
VRFEAAPARGGSVLRWSWRREKQLLKKLLHALHADDVFYDIGANLGLYSCLTASRVPRGAVVAFEPHPGNHRQLQRNIALNPGRIEAHRIAVYDRTDRAAFRASSRDRIGRQSASIAAQAPGSNNDVPTCTLDHFVRQEGVPFPTIVKIDVEGAEAAVLSGMWRVLRDPRCRAVCCEIHDEAPNRPCSADFGMTGEEICDMLRGCGFAVDVVDAGDHEWRIWAERKAQMEAGHEADHESSA